jgi:CRP/FNR family transcriptional regulator, cyclic AMP receptor protein
MRTINQSLKSLFSNGTRLHYAKNEPLIHPGETALNVYYIDSGWVQAATVSPTGEPNILHTLYEGDIFPLNWAATDKAYTATYSAIGVTTVYRLTKDSLLNALASSNCIHNQIIQNIVMQHQRLSDEHDNLHFRSASQRVAYRLLILTKTFGRPCERGVLISHPITNEYIARSSNMTRETASREMTKLYRKGIVVSHRGYIYVVNTQALEIEISPKNASTLHACTS